MNWRKASSSHANGNCVEVGNGDVNWRKASSSYANGNCVEVAGSDTSVIVRDSADLASPVLSFTPRAWSAFTAWLTLRRDARQLHSFIPYVTTPQGNPRPQVGRPG